MASSLENIITFSDYFRLGIDPLTALQQFNYDYKREFFTLPKTQTAIPWAEQLAERLRNGIPYINFTSEIARREFLIAPVLFDLARFTKTEVQSEFPLDAGDHLRGIIDYYLKSEQSFLLVEAKNAELDRGFTQLAIELVALDQVTPNVTKALYGAVSIGNVWQFGILDRVKKQVTKDLNLYTVPGMLEELLRILVGILVPEADSA